MATKVFDVQGGRTSTFPMDMLRYDSCWPARNQDVMMVLALVQQDASAIERLPAKVTVRLCTDNRNAPTKARWSSFAWRVLDEDGGQT